MARRPTDTPEIDYEAYAEAEKAFELVSQHLPEDLVADLAREVVRRLAFRMPGVKPRQQGPDAAEIERFVAALLSSDEKAGDRIILSARRGGLEIEVIYLGYIAGASRRLGAMWESDQASFMQVTLGTNRLYRIIRGLRHAIAPVVLEGRTNMTALFALTPDETHTLGIEMAADLFRRNGGSVDVCIGQSHDDIIALSEKHNYGAILLVAHSDRMLPQLLQLAVALRISQPVTPLAVAGKLIDDHPEVRDMVGADAVISDIANAADALNALIAEGAGEA